MRILVSRSSRKNKANGRQRTQRSVVQTKPMGRRPGYPTIPVSYRSGFRSNGRGTNKANFGSGDESEAGCTNEPNWEESSAGKWETPYKQSQLAGGPGGWDWPMVQNKPNSRRRREGREPPPRPSPSWPLASRGGCKTNPIWRGRQRRAWDVLYKQSQWPWTSGGSSAFRRVDSPAGFGSSAFTRDRTGCAGRPSNPPKGGTPNG